MAVQIDVRELKNRIKPDANSIVIASGDKKQRVSLYYQKVSFGKRRLFLCPRCSKRIEYLYLVNGYWSCRECSGVNPYYGIQNNTKGGYDEIAYRMKRIAYKNDIQFDFPFNYLQYADDQRTRKEKFRNCLIVLQSLENMRFHSLFFHATYKPKILRLVIAGKHPLMHQVNLDDLKNNCYNWNSGKQIIIDDTVLHQITRQ